MAVPPKRILYVEKAEVLVVQQEKQDGLTLIGLRSLPVQVEDPMSRVMRPIPTPILSGSNLVSHIHRS
jgi:hypothetical protein